MASDRRYYDDAYTTSFTGEVVAVGEHAGRPALELAVTWFYPESGGQSADTGRIGEARVLEGPVDDDGRVWEGVDAVPAGGTQPCTIDAERRFDHMQQHTGQHVLSAAFDRLLDAPTLSSTLGADRNVIEVGL
ncbi:MAG: hypothetical protein ACKOC6_04625, partial [bacterium]